MKHLPLTHAIAEIIMTGATATDLSHELGFQDTTMVYRYRRGLTKKIAHWRALAIYEKYDILIDTYSSVEDLEAKAARSEDTNADSCGHILDKLLVIASYKGNDLRQRLLKFIAQLDNRE